MNTIETNALTRKFGERVAVDGLSLSIPQGTVFGFLGPNGAGKTTTVRMLAALIAPTSGSAYVNGHEIGVDDEAVRRSVGLPERDGLLVRGVEDQSPAARAGIVEGDLIVEVAGKAVADADAMVEAITAAQTPYEVRIVRGTEERTVTVGGDAAASGEA